MSTHWILAFSCALVIGCGINSGGGTLDGVYHMDDLLKMKDFVNYPGNPEYAYCMEFRPKEGAARFRFLETTEIYDLKVKNIGNQYFMFIGQKGSRMAKIVSRKSMPGNIWQIHIHFEDSRPYKPGPNKPYDGGKDPAWKTLDDCVQAQLEHLRIAEEQRYPMSEETRPEKDTQ